MVQAMLEEWRKHFREVGDDDDKGLSELLVLFNQADKDNSKTLSKLEFVRMCQALRKKWDDESSSSSIFSDHQISSLYKFIDVDCSGSITALEFFDQIRGKPSLKRHAWIDYAFHLVDKDDDGVIDFQEVIDFYNSSDYHGDKVESTTKGSSTKGSSTKGSGKGARRSTINKGGGINSSKTVNFAKARKFITHFDRYYWKKRGNDTDIGDTGGGEHLPIESEQDIARDGRIYKTEFQLYWANRSFYFEKDDSFKREFLVGWGVDLDEAVAKEYCDKREKELREQQNATGSNDGDDTGDVTTRAVELTLSPNKPVPPSDPAPSSSTNGHGGGSVKGGAGVGSSPNPHRVTKIAGTVVTTTTEMNLQADDGTATATDEAGRRHTAFYHAENDQLESLVKEVSRLHQLLANQDKNWKEDVQSRDKIIYGQNQEIEELKRKVEDLEIKLAL